MKQLGNLFKDIVEKLQKAQFPEPKREAESLLCAFFSLERAVLYLEPHRIIDSTAVTSFYEFFQRRMTGEPLPYLMGEVSFYGCTIKVTPEVLIPRQETEILVDKIVSNLRQDACEGKCLLDLCTGSGCIGIALKKVFPLLKVVLSDCSTKALSVAQENARINRVEVDLKCGDFLSPHRGKKFHYIVCNPPYVSEEEYELLDRSVKDFEPKLALVGRHRGLEYYERGAEEFPLYLEKNGKVWFEIGHHQGKSIEEIFQKGPWEKRVLENDWSGKNRFFFLST